MLYVGVIGSHKRGAFNALESTTYISNQYVLHIIGFGETEKLCKRIEELNLLNQCQIIYDGIKSGQEYLDYCKKCHIGLSAHGAMDGSISSIVFSK